MNCCINEEIGVSFIRSAITLDFNIIATGNRKISGKTYERVQGVVADVSYLMWHYTGNTESQISAMIGAIESAFAAGA